MPENKEATHLPVEWDEGKKDDINFLISYYQYRADYWRSRTIGKKLTKHFENNVAELNALQIKNGNDE